MNMQADTVALLIIEWYNTEGDQSIHYACVASLKDRPTHPTPLLWM